MLVENQGATCRHCGHAIVWNFDRDELDRIVKPYGFWRDAEHLTEACGGPDGDPVEDMWHESAAP